MSNDGPSSNKPVPYHHPVRDFDPETFQRGLELIEESGNVARAWRTLKAELDAKEKPVPSYSTLFLWAKKSEDLIARVQADKRKEIIAIASEVAIAAGERMVENLNDPNTTHYQASVDYGIAMDKSTAWAKPAGAGPMVAFQVNLRTGDDPKPQSR